MSGERGKRVKFWLFIAASLAFFLFWSPQSHSQRWLSSTANERTNVRPQSNHPRYPPQVALSLPSSVLYYECDITLPRPFDSDKPTPNQYHLPLPSLISSQFLASVLLNITTRYTLLPIPTFLSLRLSFHLPLTLLLLGAAKLVR